MTWSNNAASPDDRQDVQNLAEELKQTQLAYYMASQMSQFKGGFLARVSHELRSPLNGLIGAHQLILSDLCDDPAEEREFLAKAQASALKMIQMLDQILDVARTEHGKNQMKLEPVQLAEVFDEVSSLTQMPAANRNIHLHILTPEPHVYARADERWLKQVLVNLVDTVIRHQKLGSIYISASASPLSGCVHICIDTPPFTEGWSEPVDFLQILPGNAAPLQENPTVSTGMTLFMSQRILEMMHGRLEVEVAPPSREGSDLTRLQCTLPLVIRD